jgi:hypothetical protein
MTDNVPGHSAWLEAYCITGTDGAPLAGPSVPLPPGTVRTLHSAEEAKAVGGSQPGIGGNMGAWVCMV